MVADEPALQERLALYFKPPGKSAAERQHVAWAARWKKQDAERTRKESENEASWRDGLRNGLAKERAALLKYPGQVTNAVYYLYHRSRGDEMKAGRWTEYNWQELAEEFGMEVARFYRDATVGFWRQYQPKLRSEGAPGNTTTNATIIGLVGLEIEAIETQVGRPHLRLVRLRWLADMPVANSTAFQRGFPPCSRRFLNS